jgi:hypothetical protein
MIITLRKYEDKIIFLSHFKENVLGQLATGINLRKGRTKAVTSDRIARYPEDLRIQISKILIKKEVKKNDIDTASVQTPPRRRKKA